MNKKSNLLFIYRTKKSITLKKKSTRANAGHRVYMKEPAAPVKWMTIKLTRKIKN